MIFKRRPKFTPTQRLLLDLLIDGELTYIHDDAPDVCLFKTEEEAEALAAVIKANSEREEKEE